MLDFLSLSFLICSLSLTLRKQAKKRKTSWQLISLSLLLLSSLSSPLIVVVVVVQGYQKTLSSYAIKCACKSQQAAMKMQSLYFTLVELIFSFFYNVFPAFVNRFSICQNNSEKLFFLLATLNLFFSIPFFTLYFIVIPCIFFE